jgi:hypothetical protein
MPRLMQNMTRALTGVQVLGGAELSLRGPATLAVPHVRVTRRSAPRSGSWPCSQRPVALLTVGLAT